MPLPPTNYEARRLLSTLYGIRNLVEQATNLVEWHKHHDPVLDAGHDATDTIRMDLLNQLSQDADFYARLLTKLENAHQSQ